MAVTNTLDSTVTAINSITERYYFPTLADQINTSNVALMKLNKVTATGDDLRQPLRYKRGTQQNYSGDEVLTTSYIEKKFAAIWQWKQKNFPIVVTGLDTEVKNAGPSKILDHVETETQAAREDALDSFGDGIYSDGTTDTKEIDGMQLVLSASNTVGGISQSSNSWWQAKVDSTTTTLSLGVMQERYEAASEGADKPNLITMTESIFNDFWGLLVPQQRFVDGDTAKAGFRNLLFNGAVVSEDSYCPSGYVVFWNLKRCKLVSSVNRKFPGKFIPAKEPVNQDVMVMHIRWAGNLLVEQPRKFAALTAIA